MPVENGRMLAAAIPGARLKLYPGGRHLFFMECADELNADIVAFLQGDDALGEVAAARLAAASARDDDAMTIASINDIDLYYEEHGDPSAEPLLLIMGFTMNAASWALQIPALAERYRVIAFDNRGVGPHDASRTGRTAFRRWPPMPRRLLDHLGIESAHIVGASMGGMIAQEFAIRYPARVRGLVLACTTPGGPHSAGYDEMMKTVGGRAGA